MNIFEQVDVQMKDALRARDKVKKTSLRNIRASFLDYAKKNQVDSLKDDDCIPLLRTMAKRHKETISDAVKGGRGDIIAQEEAELAIVNSFLPLLADEETTTQWVRDAIEASGATSIREVGKVMGQLMKTHRGEIDGNLASKVAKDILGE